MVVVNKWLLICGYCGAKLILVGNQTLTGLGLKISESVAICGGR